MYLSQACAMRRGVVLLVTIVTLWACGGESGGPAAPSAASLVGTHWRVETIPAGWLAGTASLPTAMSVSFEGPCDSGGYCRAPYVRTGQNLMFFRTNYLTFSPPRTCVGDWEFAWIPSGGSFRLEHTTASGQYSVGEGQLVGDELEVTLRRPADYGRYFFPCQDVCAFRGRRTAAPLELFSCR
jgi:hypothetical protein